MATVALVSALAAPASTDATRLVGTVGPGCSISLKKGREDVLYLRPGSYTITVRDRTKKHGFWLTGHYAGRTTTRITGLPFAGARTVSVTLRVGVYYYWSPTSRRGCNMTRPFRVE